MAAKPKLGQNFLRDPAAIRRIAAALGEMRTRTVVEIGPGKGAITEALAAQAGKLIAVEIDRELAWNLQERFSPEKGHPNVQVQRQDILAFDFAAAAKVAELDGSVAPSEPNPGHRLLVAGNLPYYITSPILLRLAANAASLDRAVLMVQREVADRVTAKPGSRDYGLLSVTLQMYGPTEALFTLPPEAFNPPPEVHSTIFRWNFAPRFADLGVDEGPFITLIKQSFAQKRKTLSNNLRAAGHPVQSIAAAFAATGISPQIRAEALSIEEFAVLSRALFA
jgi:16S rRNA (adenine1518-N6/adenine1519-N6)-dimethyltransferase